MTVAYVVAGPERHGVVLHGLGLAQASPGLASALVRLPSASLDDPVGLGPDRWGSYERVMVQVTDRLFGVTPPAAVAYLSQVARRTSLVACLHDLPHPTEGADRCARRRQAYREIAAVADVVVVASEHERMLLSQCGAPVTSGADVVVIPLPLERVDRPDVPHDRQPRLDDIGVLGFLYPGKGIENVIDAAATLRDRGKCVGVTNYGPVAEGHQQYADELEARARRQGIDFTIAGYLSVTDLTRALRSTTVPVAAHRHVSASGSIGTWLSSGRRPVVVDGGWSAELATRIPGSLTLTGDLVGALAAAFDAPATTWLTDVSLGPSWSEAALRHHDLLEPAA
ncbi:MAG: glycosyltransferase [Humibacillus sp.]|nr:glycosyltransferase [Humibacillus sp.]MDN5775711.1 glycosyltransferase [Humibacillus sp.]